MTKETPVATPEESERLSARDWQQIKQAHERVQDAERRVMEAHNAHQRAIGRREGVVEEITERYALTADDRIGDDGVITRVKAD